MLFISKYMPKNLSTFSGNPDAVRRIKQWGLQFSVSKPQKPLLLYGPVGCGKTALVHALVADLGYTLITINPPLKEDIARWERQLHESMSGSSLFSTSKLVLIEDIHKLSSLGMRGLLQKIVSAIKTSSIPVVLTADEYYNKKISPVRAYCEKLELKAINSYEIKNILKNISKAENMGLTEEQIQKIVINSPGDLRAAINDLQAQNFDAYRDKEKRQYEIIRACFRSPTYKSTKGLNLGPLSERGTLKLYVSESLYDELSSHNDFINAYNRISRADIFDGRIRRHQYWGYLRYSSDLLVWGVSSERRHPKASYVNYTFPSYIRKMGATKSRRHINLKAAKKIAPKTHNSVKKALIYVPLITEQAQEFGPDSYSKLISYYKFDEEDFASVVGLSLASLKNDTPIKKSNKTS